MGQGVGSCHTAGFQVLMEWLFGRYGQLSNVCPEMYWLRDMSLLFKFLCTMETRTAELMRKRKDTNEYQFWRLTFDADTAVRHQGMGWDGHVPTIFWEVQGVRGADQDIADIDATAFGRQISLGEGPIVASHADVGLLIAKPSPTEDDILHTDQLPTFQNTLSPQESETLLSFLTVPYLQIPLVLDFFASQDRATYLFNPQLQRVFRAVLFEPRVFREVSNAQVSQVPVQCDQGGLFEQAKNDTAETLFGTPCGLLLSDLSHCPSAVLQPLQIILGCALDMAKAEVYSAEAPFLLYMVELAADILDFVEFVLDLLRQAEHPDWIGHVSADAITSLEQGQHFLRQFRSILQLKAQMFSWGSSRSPDPKGFSASPVRLRPRA